MYALLCWQRRTLRGCIVLVESSSDGSTNTASNTCLNSLASTSKHNKLSRGYSIEARAYHIIDASEIELTPAEIARKIHYPKKPREGQYTTVRGVCAKLLQKGLVMQPYPGAYCNKITYGVRFVPLAVHNIRLFSNVCVDVKHWEYDEVYGGVKIHVCFGSERRKISGFISCDVGGMSHDACLLAVNRWFDIAEKRLGWELSDLAVTTFEVNKDYAGVRVDGVQCVTKRDFYGMIERTYQKEESLVRKEWKVSQKMSINKFEEAIQKGLAGMERAQNLEELKNEVRNVGEALKFNNSRLLDLERLAAAQFKSKIGEVDRSQNIEKEIVNLRGDFNKLLIALAPFFDTEGSGQGQAKQENSWGGNDYVA
jgi:hypothetical protein